MGRQSKEDKIKDQFEKELEEYRKKCVEQGLEEQQYLVEHEDEDLLDSRDYMEET